DAAEGGAEGDEPGGVRHHAQAVAVQGRPHGSGVDLAGVGGGRLQGEVHEVEAVPPEPVDLLQRVTGRVVHRTDLHVALPVKSIPSGYSTGAAGTMGEGGAPCRQSFSPSATQTTPWSGSWPCSPGTESRRWWTSGASPAQGSTPTSAGTTSLP